MKIHEQSRLEVIAQDRLFWVVKIDTISVGKGKSQNHSLKVKNGSGNRGRRFSRHWLYFSSIKSSVITLKSLGRSSPRDVF